MNLVAFASDEMPPLFIPHIRPRKDNKNLISKALPDSAAMEPHGEGKGIKFCRKFHRYSYGSLMFSAYSYI